MLASASVPKWQAVKMIFFAPWTYSYFEKGCRKKCTRQCWKVLWVVLNDQFSNEIWKNDTRDHWRKFVSTNGKQQKYFKQLHCQEQCIDHISHILPFGIVACTVFPTTFLKIAVNSLLSLRRPWYVGWSSCAIGDVPPFGISNWISLPELP